MTVEQLIKRLEKEDKDKVMILSPDEIGWANIGEVVSEVCTVKLTCKKHEPFDD